jgi:ubiquinone biosynthesis protein COQ4
MLTAYAARAASAAAAAGVASQRAGPRAGRHAAAFTTTVSPGRRVGSNVGASAGWSTSVIPLTRLQRAALTVGSALAAFADPARGDMVALLGELTGESAARRMRARMAAEPDGAAILSERPRVRMTQAEIAALSALPAGTFGRSYADYLAVHGFSPNERHEVRLVADPELRYVIQRYREVHDFWHVLSGLPPTVVGETAVKWLEMVQTGLPMAALSAFVAPLRMSPLERAALMGTYIPWAAQAGKRARFLMAVRYELLYDQPLEDVRRTLNFTPAPQLRVEGRGSGGPAVARHGAPGGGRTGEGPT